MCTNQVCKGSADNPCFSTANGNLGGDVVNAACLIFILQGGGTLIISTPTGIFTISVYFDMTAKPPAGGGGDHRAGSEDVPPIGKVKRVPKQWIADLGGEGYTSVTKEQSGNSHADLYCDPKTGDIYAISKQKGSKAVPEWVGDLKGTIWKH